MTTKEQWRWVGTAAWWDRWTTFDETTGCVLWTGFTCPQGYARTRWKGKDGVLVHRVAYEQVHGPFDPSLKVCHTCDTPRCMNPAHLFLGTQKDNLRDMFRKGRARPRGKAVAPLAVFPPVSGRVASSLSRKNLTSSVEVVEGVHLTRTNAMESRWWQVAGVPASRPSNAIQLWRRPLVWTPEPGTVR